MQRFTEVPSVDAALSILYGRLDSLFPTTQIPAVHDDAAITLDTMEQSGSEDEVTAIGSLKASLVEEVHDRITGLPNSEANLVLGSFYYFRYILPDSSKEVFIVKDEPKTQEVYPGLLRIADVQISPTSSGDVPRLAQYEALPSQERYDEKFRILWSGAEDTAVVTYHTDDAAYQYLLALEKLTPQDIASKRRQESELAKERPKLDVELEASLAGISKVINLAAILGSDLIPFEHGSDLRSALDHISSLFRKRNTQL